MFNDPLIRTNTDDFFVFFHHLKLGEQLINPFGDDDEDFELNWIIDRHIKVSLLGVDILNQRPPPLIRDTYFGDTGMQMKQMKDISLESSLLILNHFKLFQISNCHTPQPQSPTRRKLIAVRWPLISKLCLLSTGEN